MREIVFYEGYFQEFYDEQPPKVRQKIDYVLYLISQVERVPEKFLKHLEGTSGLYEVRVEVGSNIYRIFCFFDEGNLVVLLQGFQKKSQKTPKNELERAERLKQQYFDEKGL
jgi:phage-related protein